jgi:hypothetical protein
VAAVPSGLSLARLRIIIIKKVTADGTGAGFLRVLQFPLPVLIPPTPPHSLSSSSGAGTRGQLVSEVPSRLSLTPAQQLHPADYLLCISGLRIPWTWVIFIKMGLYFSGVFLYRVSACVSETYTL